jgi:transposase
VLPQGWVVERGFGWLTQWGGLQPNRAGRLDVAAARISVLVTTGTLINPA